MVGHFPGRTRHVELEHEREQRHEERYVRQQLHFVGFEALIRQTPRLSSTKRSVQYFVKILCEKFNTFTTNFVEFRGISSINMSMT